MAVEKFKRVFTVDRTGADSHRLVEPRGLRVGLRTVVASILL